MKYWVYIVVCADNTYYTGLATDVDRRLAEHNGAGSRGARYTSSRRPVRLVYAAAHADRSAAARAEALIKQLSRAEKQRLIEAAPCSPEAAQEPALIQS